MLAKVIRLFFSNYISYLIKRDFAAFEFNEPAFDPSKAVLLIANHFSWWDGFLLFQLNKLYLKKKFHVMVTEENYKKVFFLKYLGAFPVKKNSRGMFKSLEYAGNLLNDSNNLLLVFPQGQLFSNHVEEVSFQKGLLHSINSSQQSFQYLFAAVFVDYFQKRKPTAYCYLESWEGADGLDLKLIKNAYNKHYQTSRQQHNRITI